MKKIFIFIIIAVLSAVTLASCNEDKLPQANLCTYQIESLSAESGDGYVTLTWVPIAKAVPQEYLVSWTSGSTAGIGGKKSVEKTATSTIVEGLVNDCAYIFTVQPRYESGLAMNISVSCTPKSTRIAPGDFSVMAGDGRAFATWTAPATNLPYTYSLEISANGKSVKVLNINSDETSSLVEELTNGTEYFFSLKCVYEHGDSETLSATATPGEISPIVTAPNTLYPYQLAKFVYNPAYFVSGTIQSCLWDFGDGESSNLESPLHGFRMVGNYNVKLTITYKSGKSESATLSVNVNDFVWSTISGVGYQKASNIVFSNDGQMLYTVSQTDKKLIAINAISGEIKWEYATPSATYGAGPVVGADDTIYFGTEDASGSFYAVNPSGRLKWSIALGAAVKASPAVTSDGTVYALVDGGLLSSINAATGVVNWTVTQSGNAAGVVVDATGNVYMATSTGVWSYSGSGTLLWASADAVCVTERGGSLAISGTTLYATLKRKAGVAAINMADGSTKWKYTTTKGDCYHPIADKEGTVYFCEKAGYAFAIKSDGTKKWSYTQYSNYIYNGFVLGADGKVYISQYASPFHMLAFDAVGKASTVLTIGAQTMSPPSIGADSRLYYMTNGKINAKDIKVALAAGAWSCRGGNLQGSNSFK